MNPKCQFENLEIMSRERATLARKEAEHWLAEAEHWLAEAEYWLTEAEEWRQLREAPDPFMQRTADRSGDLAPGAHDELAHPK
jgi:hypothetical protein